MSGQEKQGNNYQENSLSLLSPNLRRNSVNVANMEKINKVEKRKKMAGKTFPFEVNSCLLFTAETQQV